MRRRSYLPLFTVLLVGLVTYFLYNNATVHFPSHNESQDVDIKVPLGPQTPEPEFPLPLLPPLSPVTVNSHPIRKLVEDATIEFDAVLKRQSKTLSQAVTEYRRRYKIPPPPNFDKWFSLAQKRGVVLIDEYDSILDGLRPFWALPPATIRARAREALGFDNFLDEVHIRDGKVTSNTEGWQKESTVGMMKAFIQWLPDMDLAFNTHDEPRVVLPHEDLAKLIATADEKLSGIAASSSGFQNGWSRKPADMDYSKRVPEVRTTRFNRFAHQMTWTNSRMSCPPTSPARSFLEAVEDDTKAYSYSEISLVANHTAFTDICNSPSFRQTYGFFDRPNSFDIVHDLFPVFSQSKISSFQDILYPSPWYWVDKVPYKTSQDRSWSEKINKLYWRGSTTGGYSRDGGWRRQHRQQIVRNINANSDARVFERVASADDSGSSTRWSLKETLRVKFAGLFDVHFSHIGQCDENDCQAQEAFFGKEEMAPQEAAWKYKYLLDLDGNAFSGRFYAFLQSFSAVFKFSIFREWHDGDGWIRPWVHYIPMSLTAHEYLEVMRYFDQEDEGRNLVKQLATSGRQWAQTALRNDDLEIWFFRLLLEYGRVVDDNRDSIGFTVDPD